MCTRALIVHTSAAGTKSCTYMQARRGPLSAAEPADLHRHAALPAQPANAAARPRLATASASALLTQGCSSSWTRSHSGRPGSSASCTRRRSRATSCRSSHRSSCRGSHRGGSTAGHGERGGGWREVAQGRAQPRGACAGCAQSALAPSARPPRATHLALAVARPLILVPAGAVALARAVRVGRVVVRVVAAAALVLLVAAAVLADALLALPALLAPAAAQAAARAARAAAAAAAVRRRAALALAVAEAVVLRVPARAVARARVAGAAVVVHERRVDAGARGGGRGERRARAQQQHGQRAGHVADWSSSARGGEARWEPAGGSSGARRAE